jgi:curved DNA-binding protein CbpA
MEDDLYEILGVLPSAEDIVITAAYRVLAQRYHPDRWTGPPAEAHERMATINRAYETLKDPARRAAYDGRRSKKDQASYEQQQDQGREEVFSQAINDLEARWKIAADVFPDLNTLRSKLAKLSSGLAFSYVTVVLEKKAFNDRQALAERMQDMFLERYFGTDPKIKDVARDLILAGQRDAAKTLNELVDVMGSAVDPNSLIEVINSRHSAALEGSRNAAAHERAVAMHRSAFLQRPCIANLLPLCEAAGLKVSEKSNGSFFRDWFFRDSHYTVSGSGRLPLTFTSWDDFVAWGVNEFK